MSNRVIRLSRVDGQSFTGATLEVDGNVYDNCQFTRCRFVFRGRAIFEITNSDISDCTWAFEDSAAMTLQALQYLHSAGASDLIESLIATIRGDTTWNVR